MDISPTMTQPPLCPAVLRALEGCFDASLVVDFRDGSICHVNRAAREMFGWGEDGAGRRHIGAAISLSMRSEDAGTARDDGGSEKPWESFFAGGLGSSETVRREGTGHRRVDGATASSASFPVSLNASRLGGDECNAAEAGENGGRPYVCVHVRECPPRTAPPPPSPPPPPSLDPSSSSDRLLLREITELRSEVKRLHRTQDALIRASEDSTILVDECGLIVSVDKVTLDQFGYQKEEELIGKDIGMLMDDADDDEGGKKSKRGSSSYIERFLDTVGERKVVGKRRELRAKRKDGSTFPFELGLAEIESDKGERRTFAGMLSNISRRKEAHRMLKRSERIRRGSMDASFHPMFTIDETGTILMANKAAERDFGYTMEDFVGRNVKMVCGGTHGRDHDQYLKRYLQTGEKRVMGTKRELPARRKDGTEFPIELRLAEVKASSSDEGRLFCGFVRDLTKQKADELELKRKHRLTMGIVEASFDAMFSINERGIIRMVNQMAVEKFGWSREEFVGRNISMICEESHAVKHDDYIRRYLETGEKRVMGVKRELRARRKDDTLFYIELGLAEIKTEEEEERLFCGFVRDLTKQKENERELKEAMDLVSLLLKAPQRRAD